MRGAGNARAQGQSAQWARGMQAWGGGVCVVVNIISRSDSCRYFSWKHLSFARINCPTAPRCVVSPPSPIRISRSPYPQPSERLFDYLRIDAACSKEKPKEKPHHRLISISAAKNSGVRPLSSFQSASSVTLRSHAPHHLPGFL
jgi:hypothetical protein